MVMIMAYLAFSALWTHGAYLVITIITLFVTSLAFVDGNSPRPPPIFKKNSQISLFFLIESIPYSPVIPSCKFSYPGLEDINSFGLRPIWGVKTLCFTSHQFDWSAANRGRGGLSRTLPKPHQMQSLHIHGGQISAGKRWAGPPVLSVEEMHLKGNNCCIYSSQR